MLNFVVQMDKTNEWMRESSIYSDAVDRKQ